MQWWSYRTLSWLSRFLILSPQLEKSLSAGMIEAVGNNKTREEQALSSLQQVLETKVMSQTHLGGTELDVKLMSLIELD